MVLQVFVQSGSGGGLLVITTFQSDRISFGATLQASVTPYYLVRGNTSTPQVSVQIRQSINIWTENFTTGLPTNGTTRDLFTPCRDWSLEIKAGTGTPTAWDVDLMVSHNNGTTWTTILSHTSAGGDALGRMKHITGKLGWYARVVVNSLTIPSGNTEVLFSGI